MKSLALNKLRRYFGNILSAVLTPTKIENAVQSRVDAGKATLVLTLPDYEINLAIRNWFYYRNVCTDALLIEQRELSAFSWLEYCQYCYEEFGVLPSGT